MNSLHNILTDFISSWQEQEDTSVVLVTTTEHKRGDNQIYQEGRGKQPEEKLDKTRSKKLEA
jgi:hypothetical protein